MALTVYRYLLLVQPYPLNTWLEFILDPPNRCPLRESLCNRGVLLNQEALASQGLPVLYQ